MEEEEDDIGASQASAGSQLEDGTRMKRKRGRPIGSGGKPKSKAKSKAAPKAKSEKNKKCFHCRCTEPKVTNGKFCKRHHRFAEGMKYQASAKKEPATFNDVMSDPSKAAVALDDWERENPEGSTRKKLICWATFKKKHGVRTSYTVREGDVLMGIDDYWVQRVSPTAALARRATPSSATSWTPASTSRRAAGLSRSCGCRS